VNFDRRYSAIDDISQTFITYFFLCLSGFYCPFFECENIAVFAVIEFEDEFEARFEGVFNGDVFAS